MSLPKSPIRYLSKVAVPMPPAPMIAGATPDTGDESKPAFDLSSFGKKLADNDKRREEAYAASKKLQEGIIAAGIAGDYADNEEDENQKEEDLDKIVQATIQEFTEEGASDNAPREANLSQRLEEYARYKSFRYFLKTGKLIPLSEFDSICKLRDEEYLGGACIGLTQDLSRYAIGRATERDTSSVEMARDLTDSLMTELLQFDFRNGPLRRKYDGTKYALKKLETILYELSVTSGRDGAQDTADEPDNKRAKLEEASKEETPDTRVKRVNDEEIGEIRARMDSRDEMREKVIKRSRDGQKAAKQAIFALHRDDTERAKKLINDCEMVIAELLPVTEKEPFLRGGSFSNVLEEYAEAKLYATWLEEKRVANASEFPTLQPVEYLGGLCDLTGEVGRFAVQRGTQRDAAGVKWCLETNLCILNGLQLVSLPHKLGKKVDPLRKSVEKLEQIMYELSLIQHGRNIPADSIREEPGEERDE